MLKNVDFVSIPVRDQKRALDFYTKQLGFTVFTDQPFNDKQRWIELKIGGLEEVQPCVRLGRSEDRGVYDMHQ